jgi:hypothetical protein
MDEKSPEIRTFFLGESTGLLLVFVVRFLRLFLALF